MSGLDTKNSHHTPFSGRTAAPPQGPCGVNPGPVDNPPGCRNASRWIHDRRVNDNQLCRRPEPVILRIAQYDRRNWYEICELAGAGTHLATGGYR